MKTLSIFLVLTSVIAVEGFAIATCTKPLNAMTAGLALSLHLCASVGSVYYSRLVNGRLTAMEKDTVLLCALFVPALGPLIAWNIPKKHRESETINAHEAFERYYESVSAIDPDYERSLFTGDFARDLARELDIESYSATLRKGTPTQKRSALSRLADRRDAPSARLIRRCLDDPDQEVRLYAYAETERLSEEHEARLQSLFIRNESKPNDLETLQEIAKAHFHYAESGILDEDLSEFHYQKVIHYSTCAWDLETLGVELSIVRALALIYLGRFAEAWASLSGFSTENESESALRLARAEVALATREFDMARLEVATATELGAEIPTWAMALGALEEDV